MTLIGPGTWEAARAAVDVAITAAELAADERSAVYGCCRPPGHHATPLRLRRILLPQQRRRGGGPARAIRSAGRSRSSTSTPTTATATQSIFYSRPTGADGVGPRRSRRRLVPSLPRLRGTSAAGGAGDGLNRNLPLSPGSGDGAWLEAVSELCRLGAGGRRGRPGRRARGRCRGRRPREPARGDADGYREAGRILGGLACRPRSSRRAATTSTGSASSSSRPWRASRADDRALAASPAPLESICPTCWTRVGSAPTRAR